MSSLYHYVLILICLTTMECIPFRYDYTANPAMPGLFKLHIIPATWRDARLICAREGAVLASPINETMKQALDKVLKDSETKCGIFTGVNSISSKGYFYSIEGVALGDMPLRWLPGEPDNAGNSEACIAYADGGVADISCTEVLPFVCYKKSSARSDGICLPGFKSEHYYQTQHCIKIHSQKRSWSEANQVCSSEGAHLAIFRTKSSIAFRVLNRYFKDSDITSAFIGVHDWSGHGDWRTIHGKKLSNSIWKAEKPDDSNGKKACGLLTNLNDKKKYFHLISNRCDDEAPFICEHRP